MSALSKVCLAVLLSRLRQTSLYLFSLALLTFTLFAASPLALAQGASVVEIGSGALDADRNNGVPRWTRVNFDPLGSGTHTIRVSWNGNADIRANVFEIGNNGAPVSLGKLNDDGLPNDWTGELDGNGQYYLGIWSASGSANFVATIETQTAADTIQIGQGILDANRNDGPRWERVNFDSLATAVHTISVSWNSNADVRFNVFEADGTRLSSVVRGSNPGVWSGELRANTEYYLGVWSTSGVANYTATVSVEGNNVNPPDQPNQPNEITVSDVIEYDIADATTVLGRKLTKVNFMPKISGDVTIELQWDGSENMNLSVFETDTNVRIGSDTSAGGNLKTITANLDANTQYHANAWIDEGTANWVMRRIQVMPNPDANISNAPDNASRPNIVLINTDDQRDDTLDRLPAIQRLLARKGITYTNAIVPTPSCCPSRATLLSGQYVHNNGQFGQQTLNTPIFEKTINKYLQQSGYFTGTAGKYLHWVDADDDPAPYWDRWTNIKGGFYGVSMNFDGDFVKPGGYTTDIVFERTKDYLREFEATNDDKPWFVYLAPMAPHSPYTAEYDLRNEPVAPFVTNPAFQEADVSDKPNFIQHRSIDEPTARDVFEQRVRSLYSLDREVEQLVQYLEDSGELDNTLIIFTSDNGYMLGEHQWEGKFTPWRKSVQVPLVISWPGELAENVTSDLFVSHIDISRTILQAANVNINGLELDGHNIFEQTRTQFYMEYFHDPGNSGRIETWASIRTPDYQYTEWYNTNNPDQVSFREYYNMNVDPYQLNNLLGNGNTNDDPNFTQLSITLGTQRVCSGASCQ